MTGSLLQPHGLAHARGAREKSTSPDGCGVKDVPFREQDTHTFTMLYVHTRRSRDVSRLKPTLAIGY